jgi:CRISPR-associated protein (TIGR02710 family)
MSNEMSFYDQLVERMKQSGLNDEKVLSLYKELEPLVSEWEKMPRMDKATQEFYNSKIFPLTKLIFLANPNNRVEKQYDCLFSTLGESPHPVILAILAVNPSDKVFLFHTKETERFVDYVASESGLSHTRCKAILIDGSNVADLYGKMKDLYLDYREKKVAIDITGGKKTMSSGAAMAGFVMNADIFYIDNLGYDSDLRCPRPGAEFLYRVNNPLEIFGDIELKSAVHLFNNYNYERAVEILKRIEESVYDERPVILIRLLAEAYEYWDELQFDEAKKCMNKLIRDIKRYGRSGAKFEMQKYLAKFQKQKQILDVLTETLGMVKGEKGTYYKITEEILRDIDKVKTLMFYLYTNAERREHQAKYDTAALMMYRVLELIMQRRLMQYGINPDKPDYKSLGVPLDKILERFNKKKSEVFKDERRCFELPSPVALMDGYLLLSVLNDKVLPNLGHLNNVIRERNKNILAHGFKPITKSDLQSIKGMTDRVMKEFYVAENIDAESERPDFTLCCLPEDESLYSFTR